MRSLNGLLPLSIALSLLSSAAGALELGPCEPAKAVKIIDTSLKVCSLIPVHWSFFGSDPAQWDQTTTP